MSRFEKLPREIRDMIYTYALVSNCTLVTKGEDNRKIRAESPLPLPLLEVNKKVSEEALEIFYTVNTFQISPYPALGKPSVFTKYATLFRSVRLRLGDPIWEEYPTEVPWTKDDYISLWKKEIRTLLPMASLRTIEIDLGILVFYLMRDGQVGQPAIADQLMPELLASLPLRFRKNEGLRACAAWISVAEESILSSISSTHQLNAGFQAYQYSVTELPTGRMFMPHY